MSNMQAVYKAIALEVQNQLSQTYPTELAPTVFMSQQEITQKFQNKKPAKNKTELP